MLESLKRAVNLIIRFRGVKCFFFFPPSDISEAATADCSVLTEYNEKNHV